MSVTRVTSKNILNTNLPKEAADHVHKKDGKLPFFITPKGDVVTNGFINGFVHTKSDPKELGALARDKLGENHPNTLFLVDNGLAIMPQDKPKLTEDAKKAHDAYEANPPQD